MSQRAENLAILIKSLQAAKGAAEALHKVGGIDDKAWWAFEHVSDAIEDLEVLAKEEDDG